MPSSKWVEVKEGGRSERLKGEKEEEDEQGEGKQECAGCHYP